MVLYIDLHTGEFPSRISTPFRTLIWLRSTSSRPQPKPLWCDTIVFMPFDPGGTYLWSYSIGYSFLISCGLAGRWLWKPVSAIDAAPEVEVWEDMLTIRQR